jgi:hypothetical protein
VVKSALYKSTVTPERVAPSTSGSRDGCGKKHDDWATGLSQKLGNTPERLRNGAAR